MKIFYICLLILLMSSSWYQTILFGLLCAVLTFLVMSFWYRLRLRKSAKAIRVRFDERLAQQTRVGRELYDTMLQTVQGSKLVADDALENSNDAAYMRRALEKLSNWLGQATWEGQQALNRLDKGA
ncbi:MAG TPA: hypothetical protein VI306_24500 [Pyrinomonadaceae bacterium]